MARRSFGPELVILAGVLGAARPAGAGNQANWVFDVTTGGEDVQWTSPTAVNPAAALYAADYVITLVEVDVTWIGIPFNNVDVTDSLPPEFLASSASAAGPAPVILADQAIEYPGAPDPICLAGQLGITLNAAGFGEVLASSIVLGQCEVDLGFGIVTVNLQSVRLVGSVNVNALSCPWDLDGSGVVDTIDFLGLLAQWGTSPPGPPDMNLDGIVDTLDFLDLLAHWGPCPR